MSRSGLLHQRLPLGSSALQDAATHSLFAKKIDFFHLNLPIRVDFGGKNRSFSGQRAWCSLVRAFPLA
jgi:hypothetical protein